MPGRAVEGRRADRAPGVEGRDRAVGAEGERDTGPQQGREGVQGTGAFDAETLGVHAVLAAPQRVEGGLDRGRQAQLGEGRDGLGSEHLRVLDPVPGGPDASEAQLVGGGPYALHDGRHGGVADRVEAGLEAGLGAGDDMGGDGGRVQVGGAGVLGVGVRLVQAGGVRAEGAVDEEVAGRADRSQLARLAHVLLGPVADDPRARFLTGQPQQRREVVLGGDVGSRALVHGADTEGRGVGAGGALGLGALGSGDRGQRGGAYGVVGVADERGVGRARVAGGQVQQGCGDDRRVDVDAGEVERAAAGGLVELGACRRAPAGPAGGVPAVTEQDTVVRAGGGEVPYPREGVLQGGRAGQVEAGQGEPGGGGVHMGVGERGGDQGALQVDHLVHPVREGVRGPFRADPGDLPPLHDHRGGEGIGRTVHLSAAQQDGLRRGTGLTHAEQSHPSPGTASDRGRLRRPARGTGGRAGARLCRRVRPVPPGRSPADGARRRGEGP